MLAAALVTLLISPISWTHYWIWVVPALVWGAHEAYIRGAARYALPLMAFVALFFAYPTRTVPTSGGWDDRVELLPKGLLWTVPWDEGRELHWRAGQQVVGNLYVGIGLAVLITVATWLVVRRSWGPLPRSGVRRRANLSDRSALPHAGSRSVPFEISERPRVGPAAAV